MPTFAILRVAKLKTLGQICGSAHHTHREVPTPNADPMRKQANEYGRAKSANELVAAVRDRLPSKRRRDAVLAIEYLVTASPEWFTGKGASAGNAYFQDALRWLAQVHGTSNVVAWAMHRDESTPHLVCYVVPLDPETGRLNAKRWLGGSQRLSRMQTEFWEAVGRRHGLERGIQGSRATHQRIRQWYGQIMRPDPVVILKPEDVQRRSGESLPMLARRLTEKAISELRPTFAAAKVSRSSVGLSRKLADAARAQQHRYNQLMRVCAPVLELRSVSPETFETLLKDLREGLKLHLQRKAAVELERSRTQSAPKPIPGSRQRAVDTVSPGVAHNEGHLVPHTGIGSDVDRNTTNHSPPPCLSSFKYLLVVDLKTTCWANGGGTPEEMEIIQFDAVLVRMEDLAIVDERSWSVRPWLHPQLSEFCMAGTGIRQEDVDNGLTFEGLGDAVDSWVAPYREGLG